MQYDNSEIMQYIQIAKKKHKEGKLNQANEIYKKLINQKIFTYDLLISYGLFNREINNLSIAKNLFILTIKKYPLVIKPYLLLADIFRSENNINNALKILNEARKIEKFNSDIDYSFSITYKLIKQFKEAISYIDSAINIQPNNDIYKILKADILIESFQNNDAKILLKSLNLQNNSNLYLQSQILTSKIYVNQKNFKKAEKILLKLRKLFNSDKVLYLNLSDLYFKNKDLKKGILILKEGLNKFPNFIPLMFNLAIMYRNLGFLDLSIETHVEILSKDKFNSNSYYELSTMYNFSNHNDLLKTLFSIDIENLSLKDKIYICFSKANVYHSEKDYKKSAHFLTIANEEKLKLQESDLKRKLNTGQFYRNLQLEKIADFDETTFNKQYLFIVGMPRCGSTLLESILSLNNEVKDMGEVQFLEESLQKSDDLLKVKKLYEDEVMLIDSQKKIYTDKNLFNFLYCPIIYRLFPNARIIYCKRNPLDNILSIYRTNFLNQSFSSSLKDITELYLYHLELMNDYKKMFGSIIYIYDHDSVVRNPKKNIQSLINWLEWEWDEKYLSPQISNRSVFTASSAQIRQKINSNSSGYWKKYEDLLRPVRDLIPTCDW
jgi:hypothetical protein